MDGMGWMGWDGWGGWMGWLDEWDWWDGWMVSIDTKFLQNFKMSVPPMFHIGGTDIELVNKVKYIGLHIDNSLTWKCQIENIKGKFSRTISRLKYCKNFVPRETLKDICVSIFIVVL